MPASSPKKRRVSPPPMSAAVDDDVADDLVPLSVSTYHQRRAADEDDDGYSDEDEDEDGNGDFTFRDPHAEGLSATDEEEEEDDPDDDGVVVLRSGPSTPSRRSGSTSSRPGTPGSAAKRTPSKRKTPTPRKAASAQKAAAASAAAGTGPFVRLTPSDAYFTAASRPLRASTAVFSSLVPPLTHQQSAVLLAKSRPKHADEIADLAHEHEARWDGWEAELDVGFGLLFYGLGSKMALLNAFAEERLAEKGDVVVVNGLFPRLSVRDVLTSIEASIVSQDFSSARPLLHADPAPSLCSPRSSSYLRHLQPLLSPPHHLIFSPTGSTPTTSPLPLPPPQLFSDPNCHSTLSSTRLMPPKLSDPPKLALSSASSPPPPVSTSSHRRTTSTPACSFPSPRHARGSTSTAMTSISPLRRLGRARRSRHHEATAGCITTSRRSGRM
jgi:hypothetical protein